MKIPFNRMKNHSFAVIFDMDGVIVDSNPYHRIALGKFCESHGYHLSDKEMREQIFGRTNKDWLTRLFGRELPVKEFLKLEEEKERIFRELIEPDIVPVSGLLNFLEKLKERDIPRAIATSAPPANVSFTLEKTGSAGFFETIIDGSMVTHSKPHPEIYIKTAKTIGFATDRCLVIEDSLSGIASAREAGCPVIGITTTHSAAELTDTQMTINNFNELKIQRLYQLLDEN
jgi:HAD superfamily hydrolase (TIGR01509 family)